MESIVSYSSAYKATNAITIPTTLTTSEVDLYKVVLGSDLKNSQITVYGNVTLGAVASATFNYYLSTDGGTTWFPVSLYNTSTGEITQRSVVVDSGTYSASTVSYFADNVPLGATTAFKVTGKSASGTPAFNLTVMVRNN